MSLSIIKGTPPVSNVYVNVVVSGSIVVNVPTSVNKGTFSSILLLLNVKLVGISLILLMLIVKSLSILLLQISVVDILIVYEFAVS